MPLPIAVVPTSSGPFIGGGFLAQFGNIEQSTGQDTVLSPNQEVTIYESGSTPYQSYLGSYEIYSDANGTINTATIANTEQYPNKNVFAIFGAQNGNDTIILKDPTNTPNWIQTDDYNASATAVIGPISVPNADEIFLGLGGSDNIQNYDNHVTLSYINSLYPVHADLSTGSVTIGSGTTAQHDTITGPGTIPIIAGSLNGGDNITLSSAGGTIDESYSQGHDTLTGGSGTSYNLFEVGGTGSYITCGANSANIINYLFQGFANAPFEGQTFHPLFEGADTIVGFKQGVDKIELQPADIVGANSAATSDGILLSDIIATLTPDGKSTILHLNGSANYTAYANEPSNYKTIEVVGVTHMTSSDFLLETGASTTLTPAVGNITYVTDLGNGSTVNIDGNDSSTTQLSDNLVVLSASAGNDTISLAGNDTLQGGSDPNLAMVYTSGNNTINTIVAIINDTGGSDTINGTGASNYISINGNANNFVHGGDGTILDHGTGNDMLFANALGAHSITPGSGSDTIEVRDGTLATHILSATIYNFTVGTDVIALAGGAHTVTSANLSNIISHMANNSNNNAVLTLGGETITFDGIPTASLHASDFILV